jgi:hypothetical protein
MVPDWLPVYAMHCVSGQRASVVVKVCGVPVTADQRRT